MNRREFIAAGAGAAAVAMSAGMMSGCTTGAACACKKGKVMKVCNKDYYKGGTFDAFGVNKGGTFDGEKARQAYFDLMRSFNYPVFKAFTDEKFMLEQTKQTGNTQYLGFWGLDFGKGDFAKYGMGGVIWVDEVKEEYFGHDIYLLPFQSIPEHSHVAQKIADNVCQDRWTGEKFNKDLPPKMESWLVRNGWVWGFSEVGEPNLDKFPEAKAQLSSLLWDHKANKSINLKSLHVEKWEADGIAHKLPKACTWHFMMGGSEGAIVTEFANFHDSKCNRFSVPGVVF